MILIIFRNMEKIRDERGSVQIIESTLVIPIILLSICILVILFIKTITKSIAVETIYNSSIKILHEDDIESIKKADRLSNVNKKLNGKLKNIGYEKVILEYNKNIFAKNIKIKELNGKEKVKIISMNPVDIDRKIKLIDYIFDDLKELKIENYKLKDIFKSLEKNKNNIIFRN